MSEILKTEAVVLHKLNYGDTSSIITLFTKEHGKLTAIIKGGRSPKSKMGMVADPLNHLQVILYNKQSREVQLISSMEIISHFSRLKEDYEKLKYAYGVLELVKYLIPEHEQHLKLFKGVIRIFELLDKSVQHPAVLFGRFFLFFLSEIGYELQFSECSCCGKANLSGSSLSYNFEIGILCGDCKNNYIESFNVLPELFEYLNCLKRNENPGQVSTITIESAITLMERFLKHHVNDFRGIQSFQLFK